MNLFFNPPVAELPLLLKQHDPHQPIVPADVLSRMVAALGSLYDVQSRLWAIPDKAEILPGISGTVTRRAYSSVRISVDGADSDVSPAALASIVLAARAVGVKEIMVDVKGATSPALSSIMELLEVASQPSTNVVDLDVCVNGAMPGAAKKVCPFSVGGSCVLVADGTIAANSVLQDLMLLCRFAGKVVVVTTSPYLASMLPAQADEMCAGMSVVTLPAVGHVVDAINRLRPSMVVLDVEDNRSLPERASADTTFLLGPIAGNNADVDSLASLATPIVPLHIFTHTIAVVDPLTSAAAD